MTIRSGMIIKSRIEILFPLHVQTIGDYISKKYHGYVNNLQILCQFYLSSRHALKSTVALVT